MNREKQVCDVLADLRLRFASGNSVTVRQARLSREEFAILCAGFANWSSRVRLVDLPSLPKEKDVDFPSII